MERLTCSYCKKQYTLWYTKYSKTEKNRRIAKICKQCAKQKVDNKPKPYKNYIVQTTAKIFGNGKNN